MQNHGTKLASVRNKYGLVSSMLSAACAGAMILAPRRLASYLSLPQNPALIRLLAARDLLIGATLLNDALRHQGLAMRGVADATDAALILARPGLGQRASRASTIKAALALTGAVCALGLALTSRGADARA
jgi:hypothetical protein